MTSTETAVSLMRMALALLDREGRSEAAARLRAAIDLADAPETLTMTSVTPSKAPMQARRC